MDIAHAFSVPPEEVEFTLLVWPDTTDLDSPCWRGGPAKFRVGPRTENPLRHLAAQALGHPLDPIQRLHRLCKTTACRNLLHYELIPNIGTHHTP